MLSQLCAFVRLYCEVHDSDEILIQAIWPRKPIIVCSLENAHLSRNKIV